MPAEPRPEKWIKAAEFQHACWQCIYEHGKTSFSGAQSGSKDGPYLMNVSQMRSITVKNGILVQYIQHPRIMILEDQMFLCIYGCTCCIYIYACNGMWQNLLNTPLSLATKFVCLKKNAFFFSKFWDCLFCSSHNYLFEHETAINLPTPAQ